MGSKELLTQLLEELPRNVDWTLNLGKPNRVVPTLGAIRYHINLPETEPLSYPGTLVTPSLLTQI